MFGMFKDRRRDRLRAAPFPGEWRKLLEAEMPLYKCLTQADRDELEGHLKVLIGEKAFVGANGVTITDEMRVLYADRPQCFCYREPHYSPMSIPSLFTKALLFQI